MSKRFMRRLLVTVTAVCMMIAICMPAMAADTNSDSSVANASTEDPRDSILQVMFAYVDDGGQRTYFTSGTCFLINDEYVLTNKHIFDLDVVEEATGKTVRDTIKETYGLSELADNDPHLKLFVFANKDMNVEAKMHENVQSDEMDFAALKLSEKLYDRQPVVMGDSDEIKAQDTIYAMGFPADSVKNKKSNTKTDVSIVDGIISKVTVTGNVDIIEHTASLNHGNSGGPLFNANNQVIGINEFIVGQKNYTIQINPIKEALDTFGIAYASSEADTVSGVGSQEQQTPEEVIEPDPALVSELQSQISQAKAFDTKGYTEESVQVLNDSIGAAEATANNMEATNVIIQGATDDLKAAVAGMEEKSGPNIFLIVGIIAAFVVLVAIIIIAIVVSKGNKNKNIALAPSPQPIDRTPHNTYDGNINTVPQREPEGVGETTLLDAGAGETTLLSGGAGSAYLIRKKNGEKIVINSQNFSLGKERRKVNYCISDNTSVSRCHVIIVKKGSDYYAVDQGATNFTFVNGVQLSPKQETLLSDKSVLKASDEEFEFHLS